MSDEEEKLFVFDPSLCSGCMRCMTTCSTYTTGETSLSKSRIHILRHEGYAITKMDEEEEVTFDVVIDDRCDLCEGNPQCVRFCGPGALTYLPKEQAPLSEKDRPAKKIIQVTAKTSEKTPSQKERDESVPKGYAGNTLIINLDNQEADILPTAKFWADYDIDPRLWLGGDGFITKILWKDFPKAIDPLSPENEIIITAGPWTATAAPQAGRGMLGCISPETGGFTSGSFGWLYLCTLKYAGFDIVIIRGKAKKPIYIFIDDKETTFKDASHLW